MIRVREAINVIEEAGQRGLQRMPHHFYRVRLEDMLGKKSTIVDNITESTTAEVLARRLNAWKHS